MTIAQDNLAKSSALLSGKMAVNIVCSEIRGKKELLENILEMFMEQTFSE